MARLFEVEFRALSPGAQIAYVWNNKSPEVWTQWPFMPMVNNEYTKVMDGCGLLYAGTDKFGIVHCNLHTVPHDYEKFLDLDFTTYANYQQMADAGWRVD